MEFGLSEYISVEISKKSHLITLLSEEMKSFLHEEEYGSSLKSLFIGIVCVSPQFETFFKPRKPKYIKDKKTIISQATRVQYEIEKCLEYDIKIDFETFKNGKESECRKLLAKEILESLSVLDDMKGKINDFNAEQFKADLENYFKEKELI